MCENITLDIKRSEFFGLFGESGSSKITLGRTIPKAAPINVGSITFDDGEKMFDIAKIPKSNLLEYCK